MLDRRRFLKSTAALAALPIGRDSSVLDVFGLHRRMPAIMDGDYAVKPLPAGSVRVDDAFWRPLLRSSGRVHAGDLQAGHAGCCAACGERHRPCPTGPAGPRTSGHEGLEVGMLAQWQIEDRDSLAQASARADRNDLPIVGELDSLDCNANSKDHGVEWYHEMLEEVLAVPFETEIPGIREKRKILSIGLMTLPGLDWTEVGCGRRC